MIDNKDVRVIDDDGNNLGVLKIQQALQKAVDAGLDLVEVSPKTSPPVCRIMNYGKYKYMEQKRKAEARKKQKTINVKEIKFRPGIEQHDYDLKMRSARKFLDAGDKVKITLRYRGREMAYQDIGMALLERIKSDIVDVAKIEHEPSLEGRQAIMILAPQK